MLEHRGRARAVAGLGSAPRIIAEIAIGTEDSGSLYDRYHGPTRLDPETDEVQI